MAAGLCNVFLVFDVCETLFLDIVQLNGGSCVGQYLVQIIQILSSLPVSAFRFLFRGREPPVVGGGTGSCITLSSSALSDRVEFNWSERDPLGGHDVFVVVLEECVCYSRHVV